MFHAKVWFGICVLELSRKLFHEILPNLVEKMKQIYVWLKLTNSISTTSFDLWMSKGAHDVFTFVINFLGFD
jgi:hypothetical protein